MTTYKKVAVTVPADTYAALERARSRLGKSRSEVVALAVKEWLHGLEAGAARKRYVEGYLQLPESRGDVSASVAIAAAATADWSTWEPGPPSRASESPSRASESPSRAPESRRSKRR
jgi:hypothetical protein